MAENLYFRTSINGFNKTDVLEYIKGLLEKNAKLISDIEGLKKELQEQKQLAEGNSPKAAEIVPEEIDIDKLSEQKLGRVMYDARRFSDLIIKEANDRADFIFVNAAASSDEMNERVNALKNEVEGFSAAFSAEIAEITEKLSALGNSLSDFSAGAMEEKKNFEEKIGKND